VEVYIGGKDGWNNRIISIAILEALETLVQVVDPDDEVGDGVEEPVEEESGGDEEGVALALHDGFLVAKVLRRGAGICLTTWTSLVLPIYVHEKEQTEGNNREERLQQVPGHSDQTLSESVQPRDGQENDHYGLCGRGVP